MVIIFSRFALPVWPHLRMKFSLGKIKSRQMDFGNPKLLNNSFIFFEVVAFVVQTSKKL